MNFPKAFASAVVAVGLSTIPVSAQQIETLHSVNNTQNSVTFLSIVPVESIRQGLNLLAVYPVEPGYTSNMAYDLYGSCNFNIEYRFNNSATGTTFQQDLCANTSFNFN